MSGDPLKEATNKKDCDDTNNNGGQLYLLLENASKANNLGPVLRCAAAFAIHTVVAIGYSQCSTEGSHGASKHVEIVAFPTVDQAVSFLRTECNCESFVGLLGGVSINNKVEESAVVEDVQRGIVQISRNSDETVGKKYPCSFDVGHVQPFSNGNCCLVLSKSWRGLPISLASCCDMFVHVPHAHVVTPDNADLGVELLDSQTCLAIALHHFSIYARPDERAFKKQKFEKGVPVQSDRETKSRERRDAKEKAAADAGACFTGSLGDMFSTSAEDY